jgi:pyruvate ferredoxin oxidoreductase beta subunit
MTTNGKRLSIRDLKTKEYFFGHKACAGCGGSLAVRLALKVLGDRTFVVFPAGCMAAVGFIYPQMALHINAEISTFPGTASMLSGIAAGAKSLGLKDYQVVGFAGDGGTADIGLQALSGAIDRRDKIIYICYDNEAYMNTGIQKSGLTPFGCKTTTTPVGTTHPGSISHKKNVFDIVTAHDIEYAAVASIGYPLDYINKVNKAMKCSSTSFIHVFASCPTGWGTLPHTAVEIAKEAVDCGLWILTEYESGEYKINKKPTTFSSIETYLKKQGRFKHLTAKEIEHITLYRDHQWKKLEKKLT